MGTVDSATWAALGLTLTLLGLVASFVAWRRKGAASGVRGVAWSLLPLAAALTGTLRLLWEMTESVVDWAARFVFSPTVWLGVALTLVSVLLFAVSSMLRRRTGDRSQRPGVVADGKAPSRKAVAAGSGEASTDEDLADIEAILRKHGIS